MKKYLSLTVITLAMVGCGGSNNKTQETSSSSAAVSSKTISSATVSSAAVSSAAVSSTAVSSLASLWPQPKSKVVKDPAMEQKIEALLVKMTVAEKVGQTIQAEVSYITPAEVTQYHIGSVLNGGGSIRSIANPNQPAAVSDWVKRADLYYNASVDTSQGGQGIPVIWGTDAVHGANNVIGATLFPHNIALGAANNPELMKKIGEATAQEVAATGINWTFAPTLAVVRNDRWGRTYESFSEDPAIVKSYAGQIVDGLQGVANTADFLSSQHILATAKHFIGDGGTTNGIDRGNTEISEAELVKLHAQGYVSAIESGVQTVMASFSSWNGDNMHGNHHLLTDILKTQMGFDGLVVGDWSGHEFVPGCTANSCAAAFNAGIDMFMAPSDWKKLFENTLSQVNNGAITQARLDDAVRRILRVKMRAGVFTNGAPSTHLLAGKTELLGSAEHRAIARQAVRESLILLKNKNAILPLKANSHILIAGDGADNIGKQAGGWSVTWQGINGSNDAFPGATSIYHGLADAAANNNSQVTLSETGEFTQKPDVAVVIFGENPYAEMNGDIATMDFLATKPLALLKKLKAQGIPVVSVFIAGRPLWVNPELNASDAFVMAWLPGTEGAGIADVLMSKNDNTANYDFKGKLSFSWPAQPDQTILNKDQDNYAPLFAYGFGLTYADQNTLSDNLSETGQTLAQSSFEIFKNQPVAPWGFFLQDPAVGFIPVTGTTATIGAIQYHSVDRNVQGDSVQLQWSGASWAIAGLGSQAPANYSDAPDNAALVFDVKVNVAPTADVNIGMQCAKQNCFTQVLITPLLQKMPLGEWKSTSISLACFTKAGIDLSLLVVPFGMDTTGKLDLTLNHIRIESKADADIKCP